MTYFLCSRDHYVSSHRGESLQVGDICPATDCASRLKPAPEGDERCPRCHRGALIPTTLDGTDVLLCSFCARSRLVEGVTALTGAERVAKHRAAKRALLQPGALVGG